MAKRGDTAREAVKNKIIEVFGDHYITTQDKKIIVEAQDGTEWIQFAITMTMPKTPVQKNEGTSMSSSNETSSSTPIDISDEDRQAVEELMRRLNIK